VLADVRTQINVITALTIRELQSLGRQYNYGFAWALLEPIMFIAILRVMRSVVKGLTPGIMPPTTFIVLGIIPTYLFMNSMTAVIKVIGERDKMLEFPRVTVVDLALAAALRTFCIYFSLFIIFTVPASIIEHVWPPQNGLVVLGAVLAMWVLGTAMGFLFGAVRRVFLPIKQFVTYYTLANRMVGGMLFVITQIPSIWWPWFTWNPVLHCSEMVRDGWFVTYTSPIASPAYVMEWMLGLMLLGLSLERFVRRMPYV